MNLGIIGKNFLITGGNGMLATDISKHLRSFGYNVIDDFFDITVPFLWEQILNTNKIDFIVHAAAITEITTRRIAGKDGGDDTIIETKVKLADKGQNLERIGRHLKLFTDKTETSSQVTVTIDSIDANLL